MIDGSWQERYREKLVTAEHAASLVKSGDLVRLPLGLVPVSVMNALAKRRRDLDRVTIIQSVPPWPYPWLDEPDGGLRLVTEFISAPVRQQVNNRAADFMVSDYALAPKVAEPRRHNNWHSDVYIGVFSPPDSRGFMSFGYSLWYNKGLARAARIRIGEIMPFSPRTGVIRTGGDNFIHVSEIDYLVEHSEGVPRSATGTPELTPARQEVLDAIGGLVADLVDDGDFIQLGAGSVSSCMGYYLVGKRDLSIDSEIIPPSAVELVKLGVATGKNNKRHPGKAIASLVSRGSDYSFVDGNPAFELYGIEYINSVPRIANNKRQVAINQALTVDLTGQVAAESIGPTMFTGPGGQLVWTMGAMYSEGGRSIHVLPSISEDGSRSRIVPELEPGTVVTVPRTLVDFVVTEQGVANLQGKTEAERAKSLIAIAHPKFREELAYAARRLFG